MYVWQMNDGSWNISLETSMRHIFSRILDIPTAFKAYNRFYRTEREAREAVALIRNLLATT